MLINQLDRISEKRSNHKNFQNGILITEKQVSFKCEQSLEYLPKRQYDFIFSYLNGRGVLGFDGEQHFKYTQMWHEI